VFLHEEQSELSITLYLERCKNQQISTRQRAELAQGNDLKPLDLKFKARRMSSLWPCGFVMSRNLVKESLGFRGSTSLNIFPSRKTVGTSEKRVLSNQGAPCHIAEKLKKSQSLFKTQSTRYSTKNLN
jgi:hypothetical protein